MADPVSLAITVALNAAAMAATAMRKIEGPRLTDLSVTVADYGTPLNYIYGLRRVEVPCFYAEPIQERKKKRKTKGGKYKDYTYFGTWAVAVADHAIDSYSRIWFDRHLVYDVNAISASSIFALTEGYEIENSIAFFYGTEDQLPHERMIATIEAEEGPDTCPAYRGVSYIFFIDVPLEKLGNRFPQVSVECVINGEGGDISTEPEILLVGQQGADTLGYTGTPINFALTDGIAAAPSEGDIVLISVAAGRYPLYTDTFQSAPVGYEPIGDSYFASNFTLDFQHQSYYKIMGATPDTSFTPGYTVLPEARNAFQIIVFRNVDPITIFASEVTVFQGGPGPVDYYPASIQMGPTTIDPGYCGHNHSGGWHSFQSFALLSLSGQQGMPLVLGGAGTAGGADEVAGNLEEIFEVSAVNGSMSFTRTCKSIAIYGLPVELFSLITLREIINDVCFRSNLPADQFDASLCTQEIDGYSWTQGSGKDIIAPLLDLYDVDSRPDNFGIEFLPRGSAIGDLIENSEFAVSGQDDGRFTVTIKSESDLPRRLFFTFADRDSDQQPNTVVCQRTAAGVASARDMSIDMTSLVMTPSRASDLANRMFRRIWFSRELAEFGLTAQRLALQPGDVHPISLDDNLISMRLLKFAKGANGIVSTSWERDHPNLALLPGMTGAVASGRPPAEIYVPGPSAGFFLDIPLLDDAHDLPNPFLYIAAGPLDENDFWTGADISYSDSGLASEYAAGWDAIEQSEACTHGSVLTPLPDALTGVIDYGSAIQVQLLNGELQSMTEAQILADSSVNLALVGNELIQFITATLIEAKLYELSGLVRGARGTEAQTGTHDYIEDFLLMDLTVKRHTLGASEIGDTDYYIAATLGTNADIDDAVAVPFTAAANKPYSPAHLVASYDDYSGEWTISWIRRSRIGGSTLNGQNVPLGETSESYKLQILDGAGAVLRTIEQATNSYVYGIAEQAIDFGAPVTDFAYKVAQQSPALGIDGFFSTAQAAI